MTAPNTGTPPPAAEPQATPSTTPAGANPPEYRFGAAPDVPTWAQGKSASEVLGLAKQMADALARGATPPPAAPTAPSGTYAAAPPAPAPGLTDDDFVTRPLDAVNRAFEMQAQQRYNPVIQNMAQQVASMARGQAEMMYGDDFKRWSPEIDQLVIQVPPEQRSVDLYAKAVEIVRGRHVNDLVQERLQQQMAAMPGTERSMGGGAAPVFATKAVDFSKLPSTFKAQADKAGLTESQVQEFCYKVGITPEQWMQMAANDQTFVAGSTEGVTMRGDKLGIASVR